MASEFSALRSRALSIGADSALAKMADVMGQDNYLLIAIRDELRALRGERQLQCLDGLTAYGCRLYIESEDPRRAGTAALRLRRLFEEHARKWEGL